jgi:hypothetical protein
VEGLDTQLGMKGSFFLYGSVARRRERQTGSRMLS